MEEKTSLALTCELFQLMKQFPRPKLKQSSIDGLTRSEYELLVMLVMRLGKDNDALTVTEISALLQITPAGVTHLINPLEETGYIERRQDPNDRRIVRVRLTNKGTQVAQALVAEVQDHLVGLVNHLGEEDSRTLIRLMAKAIEFFAPQFEDKTAPGR